MDYKEKYESALERARIWKDKSGMPKEKQCILDDIFPELKESKEEWMEKLRKEIITFLGNKKVSSINESDAINVWITWLEKQSEIENINNDDLATLEIWEDIIKENKEKWQLSDWFIEATSQLIQKVKYIEKQGNKPQGKKALEAIKEERINNQNCVMVVDKVEPAFKVGDWVVWDNKISCHIDNIYQGKESLMYTITDAHNMTRSYSAKGFDNNAHLWNIKDAKDGDILAEESCIFIIQKLVNNGTAAKTYFTLYDDGDFDDGTILYFDIDSTKPATKEQRELLFKRMHEAGYKWSAEMKELMKIETSLPSFDEQQGTLVVKQNPQPKEWSEEDENNLTDTCVAIRKFYHGTNGAQELIDWLQSIKQRMKGG